MNIFGFLTWFRKKAPKGSYMAPEELKIEITDFYWVGDIRLDEAVIAVTLEDKHFTVRGYSCFWRSVDDGFEVNNRKLTDALDARWNKEKWDREEYEKKVQQFKIDRQNPN